MDYAAPKIYAIDIETVSQGKRARDYTDNKPYKLGNVKAEDKVKKALEEKRNEAAAKHGLFWFTGKVVSIAIVDIYGDDEPVCIYGVDEVEILKKASVYLDGHKLWGMSSEGFDCPFLIGRYMANDLPIPRSLKAENRLANDVNKFFGWSTSSSQRGSLADYIQGLGMEKKPLTGNKVQGIYDTVLAAKMEMDEVAEKAAWKEIIDYNIYDSQVVKEMVIKYNRGYDGN